MLKSYEYRLYPSDVLATFITPSIIKSWYNQEDNLNLTINEISYTRSIEENYFSQSRNTRDLEDAIAEIYEVEYLNDEEALINRKEL